MLSQIALVAFLAGSIGWLALRLAYPSKLPPGPKGLPLLGNALQLPLKLQFLKLSEWAKEFGDMYTVNAAGKKLIVLSSAKTAADILDRMSGVTSGRPRLIMAGEIMTQNLLYAFMQYEDRWRRLRRLTHEGFNIRACEAYYLFQDSEAANLVLSLLRDPNDMPNHLMKVTANSTWRALYSGPTLTAEDEKKIQRVADAAGIVLKAAAPLAYVVDVLPFLKALPTWMAGWKRYGEGFFRDTDSFFHDLLEEGKVKNTGTEHHLGFIALSADSFKRFEVTDQEAAWTAGGLFAAGVETTAAVLHQFVLAMVLYPEAMKAAQKQIDAVVGPHPPRLKDREKLPYIQALVKETHRWRPVTPLGLPHVATEELEYKGFVFPKGSVFISNIWSIAHDPAVFSDHEVFRPERYLNPDGSLKDSIPNYHDDIVTYGYGRRICPGRDFANNSLFIDMAYLLWAFDILKAKDMKTGKEIIPDSMAFVDRGLSIHPAPFQYELRARRPDLRDILACP